MDATSGGEAFVIAPHFAITGAAMRLVHITDLHYTRGNAFQRALITSLLNDLKKLHDSGYVPDFLLFSGDLVNNPDEDKIYEEFEANFLRPVLDALRLSLHEVVLCPGNHDVSRRAISEWSDERRKLVEAMTCDQTRLEKHLQAPPTRAYASALSAGFFDLAARCGHPWSNPFVHHYSFPAKKTSFIALNTGYGCGLEGSQHDRGKLAVSANQVLTAFQQKPEDHGVVSLMHHTMADLTEASTRVLSPMLAKQAAIYAPVWTCSSTFPNGCYDF
jgi:3',5'-cyclic AMP phosphodiesterase CpdA